MNERGLPDYLDHLREAARDACNFVKGLSKDDFFSDKRTQQTVVMNLIIIGEVAAKVMDRHAAFAAQRSDVPWRNMRGTRNRIAHGAVGDRPRRRRWLNLAGRLGLRPARSLPAAKRNQRAIIPAAWAATAPPALVNA